MVILRCLIAREVCIGVLWSDAGGSFAKSMIAGNISFLTVIDSVIGLD